MSYREDDISLLLPTWRAKVQQLIDGMKAAGFKPILFDGLRTREEAARNALKGTGIKDSMHCYGCAADLICADHGWSCESQRCKFFRELGAQAKALGMVWGGEFRKQDLPHVQGIDIAKQNEMRALGTGLEKAAQRDALVKEHFHGQ